MSWNIELYITSNGEEPVMEFLKGLPQKHKAKAIWEIDLLEEHGLNLQKPYVKSIRGERYRGLLELRIQQGNDISRVFYFHPIGNTLVLLHGFIKKTMKTPKKELEIARRYKEDYIRRFGKHE